MPRDQLTNEKLKGLFKSNFDLANQAIALARHYVKSGQEVKPADQVLDEIRRNPSPEYIKQLEELETENGQD